MKLPTRLNEDCTWLSVPAAAEHLAEAFSGHSRWRLSVLTEEAASAAFATRDMDDLRQRYAAVRWQAEASSPQTFDWYAAIDPVYLQADLRDVYLRQWPVSTMTTEQSAALADVVRGLLASDEDPRLSALRLEVAADARWYLCASQEAALDFKVPDAASLLGQPLRHHKPVGTDAQRVRRLSTEIQMSLHQHPCNTARAEQGLPPINGVWLYGAGALPAVPPVALPRLISDDLFLRGCWQLLAPASERSRLTAAVGIGGAVVSLLDTAQVIEMIDAQRSAISTIVIDASDALLQLRRRSPLRRWWSRLAGDR